MEFVGRNKQTKNEGRLQSIFGFESSSNSDAGRPQTGKASKRLYQHIELWKRRELIEWVIRKEETMKNWSERLGINYCTAKHIMKVFRKTGSFETELMRKKRDKEVDVSHGALRDLQIVDLSQTQQMRLLSLDPSGLNVTMQRNLSRPYEEICNVISENSWELEGVRKYTQPIGFFESVVSANQAYVQPNLLFGKIESDPVQYSFEQAESFEDLQVLWSVLGNRVYSKFSSE